MTLRIGLIGCGHIGTVHAVALQQLIQGGLVDATFTATFDTDPERAAKAARRYGGEALPTMEAALDAVDVAWICTWTAAHLAAVEAAADRGVAVFCEKPLAPDLASATRVAAALERIPHQVGLVLEWAPVFRRMREAVHNEEFGVPLAAVMRDDQYFPIQGRYGSTWRRDVAQAGGGTLIEHSIHDIDVLQSIMGEPEAVSAHTAVRFGHEGIEDTAALMMTYATGAVVQLTSIWHQVLTRESSRRIEVVCEKALMWTESDYLGPLFVQTDDGVMTIEGSPPSWIDRITVPEPYTLALAQYAEPSKAFLDGLASHDPSSSGHPRAEQARAAHRLVDRAYQSAAAGGVAVSVRD
jgi:predicted dehydrogenase